MEENNASVKDMEAAAIAYVAELANVPFFGFKVVTDIVDGDRPTQEEFFENLAAASASLQEKIPKVIDFVVGKKLSEL
jgi:5'-methylthioadenosine nucleosidase